MNLSSFFDAASKVGAAAMGYTPRSLQGWKRGYMPKWLSALAKNPELLRALLEDVERIQKERAESA